ncbi:MAG: glycosyltransferase family 2 protein [Bacillota bacterium]
MKISVVIIAHNEERHIDACIKSLLHQTRSPDEILLINHNSTDTTGALGRAYSEVRVIDYAGPAGPVFARIRGFEEAKGEHILCIDGDSVAASNWIETLSRLLDQGNVMVGSWIRMSGTMYAWLSSYYWYLLCPSKGHRATDYLWGASTGVRGEKRGLIIKALEKGEQLSRQLALAYNPDDYWLALFLEQEGGLEVTNRTWVKAYAKEKTNQEAFIRSLKARKIRRTMQKLLQLSGLPTLS